MPTTKRKRDEEELPMLPKDKKLRIVKGLYRSENGNKVCTDKRGRPHAACLHDGCKTRPSYGSDSDTKATYCLGHKLDGMEDIISKRCAFSGCKKQPLFGNPSDAKPTHCSKHKLDDMIDTKHKRCVFDGCKTQPSFGNPADAKATHCSKHKLDGMVDI
jgi:hypothetical protein